MSIQPTRFAFRAADLIRRCQRNLPCPLLARAADLPPIPSDAAAPLQFAVLCQPKTFRDALWSAWSWMRFVGDRARLVLGVDGEITPAMAGAARALFPGVELIGAESFLGALSALGPEFAWFARHHRFGRKLAFPYFLQLRGPLLYSDCDILLFRHPDLLLRHIDAGKQMLYLLDEARLVDPFIETRAIAAGRRLPLGLNAGLLYFTRAGMPEPLMHQLMDGLPEGHGHWSTDQSLFAAIADAVDSAALPPETYSSTFQGQYFWEREPAYGPLVLRHFIGPVRHHFYRRGLPYVNRQARAGAGGGA